MKEGRHEASPLRRVMSYLFQYIVPHPLVWSWIALSRPFVWLQESITHSSAQEHPAARPTCRQPSLLTILHYLEPVTSYLEMVLLDLVRSFLQRPLRLVLAPLFVRD